ncbi:hypothetical protein ACX93W_21945 [Paenibacillus sp. CAU 1782]
MNRKFVVLDDSQYVDEFSQFCDKLVYIQQNFDYFSRLVIWPNERAIDTLKKLLEKSKENFEVMYILMTSRCNNDEARYKAEHLQLNEVVNFLDVFQTFIEFDSRHRVVIRSSDESLTYFVYDEENILLAYGNVELFKQLLDEVGFEPYEGGIVFPDPHMHVYHEELDQYENQVLHHFPWTKHELTEVDK